MLPRKTHHKWLWAAFTKLEREWKQPFQSVRNWAGCQFKPFEQIHTIWTGFKFKLAAVCPVSSCSSGSNLEDVGGIRFEATDGNIGAFGSQYSIAGLLFLLLGREIIRLKPHPKNQKQEVVGTKLLQITWTALTYFLNIYSLTSAYIAIHFQPAKNLLISKKSKSLELQQSCAVNQILDMPTIWHFIKWLCITLSIVCNTTRRWRLKCYLKTINQICLLDWPGSCNRPT